MFHVFALTYYVLLRCVTRCVTREYTTIFDLHDAYYSLLERYMKHVFVAGFVTGDFTFLFRLKNLFNKISKFLSEALFGHPVSQQSTVISGPKYVA